jgi:hypothetical protein
MGMVKRWSANGTDTETVDAEDKEVSGPAADGLIK